MKKSVLLFLLPVLAIAVPALTWAAGDGVHHGSISDLIFPYINFVLFFGFLIYKLKGKISQSFKDKAANIEKLVNQADIKNKEATTLLKANEEKLAKVSSEAAAIKKRSEDDVEKFKSDYAAEITAKSEQAKREADRRLDAEAGEFSRKLEAELVDAVIAKTKGLVKADSNAANKVTDKLVGEMR